MTDIKELRANLRAIITAFCVTETDKANLVTVMLEEASEVMKDLDPEFKTLAIENVGLLTA